MKLLVFEQDKLYVKKCLDNGEIVYLEGVSEGAETEFFEYLNTRGVLKHFSPTVIICARQSRRVIGKPSYSGTSLGFIPPTSTLL